MKVNYKKFRKQIPISIQLGRGKSHHYEVVYADDFKDGRTMGETTFDKKQIRIKLGMSDKDTVTTYLHEVIHAISEECQANLTENQVLALEKCFYYILKDGNIFKKEESK